MFKVFNSLRIKKAFSRSKDKDRDKEKRNSISEPELGTVRRDDLEPLGASSASTSTGQTVSSAAESLPWPEKEIKGQVTTCLVDIKEAATPINLPTSEASASIDQEPEKVGIVPGKSQEKDGESTKEKRTKNYPSERRRSGGRRSSSREKSAEKLPEFKERSVDPLLPNSPSVSTALVVPARSNAGQTSGSLSEPEISESARHANKYASLGPKQFRDNHRTEADYPVNTAGISIPGSVRVTLGRIEVYSPVNSSLVPTEIPLQKPIIQGTVRSKDLGYESDSHLTTKKPLETPDIPPPPPLSPVEQRQIDVAVKEEIEAIPTPDLPKPPPEPEKPKAMPPMPTLEDVKSSLVHRPRSGSPRSFRSGSPSLAKSAGSTVALLQERIQGKLRRANSDINPSMVGLQSRTRRADSPGNAAARLIHSVRSVSQVRDFGTASFIPVRSRNPSMDKLRVSSPELTSPREVKKAVETSHRLSIKLEVLESHPVKVTDQRQGHRSQKQKSKQTPGTGSPEKEKKSGLKKVGGSSGIKSGKSTKVSKNVKISENGSATNSGVSPTTGALIPAKPPRKSQGKVEGKGTSTGSSSPGTNGSEKVPKAIKATGNTPVAIRHAGCLSPHPSRPTSPGPIRAPTTKATTKVNHKGDGGEERRTKRVRDQAGSDAVLKKGRSREKSPGLKQEQHSSRLEVARATAESISPQVSKSQLVPSSAKLQESVFVTTTTTSAAYLTIPPRKNFLADAWTLEEEHDSCTSRSCTPSFRSLPALTPYLREAKRVSGSMFVTKTNHAAMLREKAALAKRLGLDETSRNNTLPARIKSAKKVRTGVRSSSAGRETSIPLEMSLSSGQEDAQTLARGLNVVRSASCLGLRRSRDYTYAKYILELQTSRKKSPRFVQLHRLYSSLERLGQLERSASMYDIPILSLERQLDFDAWWKVRNRNKVDEEIASISSQLSTAQRNREFFFRPRRVEDFRWKGDSALRCKQWSINELRSFLVGEYGDKRHCKSAGDLHKTAWRGTSVKEVALNMEVNALSKSGVTFAENNQVYGGPWLRRAFSMSSTLSEDERDRIKRRLCSLIKPEALRENLERRGRPAERQIVTTRMGFTRSSDPRSAAGLDGSSPGKDFGADGCLTEAAKKQLSRSLSQEIREKKVEKNDRQKRSSESGKSDDSVRTVIHVPISTQLLLKKIQKDKERDKSKVPMYSVYCSNGVPSKVTFFENYYHKPEPEGAVKPQFCPESRPPELMDRTPDGREFSPVSSPSPDLINSRSRKPIYLPSSTPNVCQPTLTAHCFLESPNKSLEYLNQSSYSSDYSGSFWDYCSVTESVRTASPSPSYHTVSIPPPPPLYESRLSNRSSPTTTTNATWQIIDPALHQPKFRYVPPPPRTNVHPMPPPLPPPPSPTKLATLAREYARGGGGRGGASKSNSERLPCNPYLYYRSDRYGNPPPTRTRDRCTGHGIPCCSPVPPYPTTNGTVTLNISADNVSTSNLNKIHFSSFGRHLRNWHRRTFSRKGEIP